MDLWIRGQDKKQLSKIVGMLLVDKELRGFTEYNKNYFELGKYNTEERALEVLDEIETAIVNNYAYELATNSGIGPDNIKGGKFTGVYEMPKE